jgi:asparagine synthetase B (glutamine-hydrolysing)
MVRPDWFQSVEQAMTKAADQHDPIALLYSGGVESSLLLHLADRITVYNRSNWRGVSANARLR